MKAVYLAIGLIGIPLFGGTVTTQASSLLSLDSGNTNCAQSSIGPATCHVDATFSDPTGRQTAAVFIDASADFGSISGRVDVFGIVGTATGAYESSFGDFIRVFGGSGAGTLITHYALVSSDEQEQGPGQQLPPSYWFQQGGTTLSYTPAVPPLDSGLTSTLVENFDVTSPIVFGALMPFAATTTAAYNNPFLTGHAIHLQTASSAQITGFTILDMSGNVVTGGSVQRDLSAVPEPNTLWACVFCLVLGMVCVRRFRIS